MTESLNNPSEKSGLPPGSLVHVGNVHKSATRISVVDYSKQHVDQLEVKSLDEVIKYKNTDSLTWVVIEGLTDISIVENIGASFGIHPLVLEDILNTHQRPKFEEYDGYLYIVLKCLMPETKKFAVNYEQVSLLVLNNFVFTFKEKQDELFSPIYKRLSNNKGRIRTQGSDYLTYSILDTIVDQNFVLIDALDETVTMLEDKIFLDASRDALNTIRKLKREIISIRRHISPIRELMAELLRSDSEIIHDSSRIYFRDVYDHTIRIIESIETYRDILSGLLDIYISSVSNKMNEVMKVLTVFASIFIPLTFIAGIYGMNFEYMPELQWKWAYPLLWAVFIIIPVVLLVYFRRKKWL